MVNGQNGYFVLKFCGQMKVYHFDPENFYFGQGHGQNVYFCGCICWQNLRLTILTTENLDFCTGHGRIFDHKLTIVILKFDYGHGNN